MATNLRNRKVLEELLSKDESKVLDEEEQELVIQSIKNENESSNYFIKSSLMILNCALIAGFLYAFIFTLPSDRHSNNSNGATTRASSLCSIIALFLSLVMLYDGEATSKDLSTVEKYLSTIRVRLEQGIGIRMDRIHTWVLASAVFLSLVPPALHIAFKSHIVIPELIIWVVPSFLVALAKFVVQSMNQIKEGVAQLEGFRYKQKGA
ncbi:hypothetical protein BJ742DRAFT_836390 [Cladochytrium replicatum]|nr:hypothetical protein BJ742DRAFT_836390 [Cladochytrium replicatum]